MEARVYGGGVHRLVVQSASTPRLRSHWPQHRVHIRASACLVAQIYAYGDHTRLPAAPTIKPSVFAAYKFHERCVTADLGTTFIDIWFGWGDGRRRSDDLVWLAL